jgi:hypothetical protein
MIDRFHLPDKKVAFRLVGSNRIHIGIVKLIEKDGGLWIESPPLIGELLMDEASKRTVGEIQKPIVFVPFSSLMFLIATQE